MARGLQNYQNRTTPDSDYPNGRIKDNDGTGNGTPVNQYTNDDLHQFLAKMLRRGGITPNGLPENEYSGHQYHQALDNIIKTPPSWITIPLINGWAVNGSATLRYRITRTGKIEIMGQLDASSATNSQICNTGVMPHGSYNIQLTASRLHVSTLAQEGCVISVQTNGSLVCSERTNAVTVFLDGLSYSADV